MSVPNDRAIVEAVYNRWTAPLVSDADIGRFTEAVVVELHKKDRRWGHLKKNPGQTQHNGHAANAVLYLSDTPGQSTAVDIMRVGDPANAVPRWLLDIPRYSASDWFAPQAPVPVTASKLGVSFFPALGLRRFDRARYDEALNFFKNDLKPDYARIFWYLADGPWGLVGTGHLTDLDRRELLKAVINDLLLIGIKPQLTVFGTWVEDAGRRDDLIAQFRETARPFASRLFLVDCYNEPGAIGVPEYGFVRQCGRALAGEGYPLLSLASPNSLHIGVDGRRATDAEVIADTSKLNDGMPAGINAITPHWGRAPWEPHRNLGPSAGGKRIINDEPRGYKSSVSAIDDPADFGRDYASSAAADEDYTLHGEPGIWFGYCDARDHPEWGHNNDVKRWQDVPRIGDIVKALHAVRGGGTVEPGQPGGEMPAQPYPNEPEWWLTAYKERVKAQYVEAQKPLDDRYPVWFARTAYDIAAGQTKEASADKHIAELRASLGLPPAA